ncbi:MAG: HD domain-containing protein [Pirellulales bacterium]|nr:HD domain-containing protein [Pirellulales bacterium]
MEQSNRFPDALAYAAALHVGQCRKLSGAPYVSHLLRVAGTVLEYGADEDEAIAALLHDAVEDQGGAQTREAIRRRFGDRVAEIIDGCTDTDQHPKPPWQIRKEAFLKRLPDATPSVRLVVAADKLDNLRSLTNSYRQQGDEVWRGFKGGRDGTLWYHRSVVDILKQHGPGPLVEELERSLREFERLVEERRQPPLGG